VTALSKDTVEIKLKNLFNKSFKTGRMVGAELEVESETKLPTIDSGTWTTIQDQSLRTQMGREYVLRAPIPYEGVETAVSNLLKSLNDKEKSEPIRNASTTSWHVHLNALDLTPNELMTRLFAYWLLEPLLIKHCGPEREANPFCLQLKDNLRNLGTFDTAFFNQFISTPTYVTQGRGFNNNYRYCAQNYTALAKFGSIEYRAMKGSLEYDEVMPWFNALTSMWKCTAFKNPGELLSYFYDHGLIKLYDTVIGERTFHKYYTKAMEEQAEEVALILLNIENNNLFTWEKWEEHIRDRQYIRILEGQRLLEIDDYEPPRRPSLRESRAPTPQRTTSNILASYTVGTTGAISGRQADMLIVDDVPSLRTDYTSSTYWQAIGYDAATAESLARSYAQPRN